VAATISSGGISPTLSKRTGQAFFVENKPGAGTVVGTQAAAQSEPDGYR
jgi:tripartite-type tricarboxylate transporter receptor subunit TctC